MARFCRLRSFHDNLVFEESNEYVILEVFAFKCFYMAL